MPSTNNNHKPSQNNANDNPLDIIHFRLHTQEDLPFIYKTWLKNLYYSSPMFAHIDYKIYFDKYKKIIENILNKPTTYNAIACLKEDHDTIIAFAILEAEDKSTTLHYIFTKPPFRKFGIAKTLLKTAVIDKPITKITHLTKIGKSIKPKDWIFDPFIV